MKPKKVRRLEKLEKVIEKLSEDEVVIGYYDKMESIRRRRFVSKQLQDGNMVWCRLGDVCPEARPCDTLDCKFKKTKDDIVNGCSNPDCCFQVTKVSKDWRNAYYIYDPGEGLK